MTKRIFTSGGLVGTATAAGSAASINNYMALKGGSGTMILNILEISISGKVAASTVLGTVLKRASTLETGGGSSLTAPVSDGPLNPSGTALVSGSTVGAFIAAATTQPTPSNTTTDATLHLALNGFGGIYRWNAAPTQQWQSVGNTATVGESILFNCTSYGGATCAFDAHIMYEPL